ncbi:MAG: protein kinase [Polyangiaceae bacterium]|nr:protein kinase [Polyangiaceae bacterium]
MLSGELIDDRFELQACAGVGGMGSVYRALDRVTNQLVALKVLNEESEKTTMRFTKEAQVLAALEHPHIVRYVAHGFAASGEPYLAMEWLEGEELEARLHRERLGVAAAIDLGLRVARALAVAHMQGVVHRDIKPSNIFLVQSDIERVKVLDFGLARLRGKTVLTQTGSIIGTPGYMSPEQARGERGRIDARADVFSLACVLYECVTGQPAFMGAHVMAVLAKVLLEEAPSARTLCPEIPKEFDKLLGRMLSKNPAMRPADGREVAEALERIAQQYRSDTNQDGPPSLSMTSDESRLVSLVTVLPLPMLPDAEPASLRPHDVFELVRRTLKPFKAAVEPFGTGGVVAVFDGVGNAGDQVAVAARSAVRIKDVVTSHVVAVFAGRSTAANPLAVGELVDRMMTFAQSVSTVSVLRRWNGGILIDDTTRSLLGSRFLVGESSGFWILQRERAHDYLKRSVLGRPVPCVGRERDLRSMLDYIDGAFEQPSARAILMVGPPGIGKSRLRLEILDRVRESVRDIFVISGRGDWLGLGSVFGLVGGALRAALSLDAVKTEAQQRDLLVEASSICGEADRIRVAAFLGEMLGIPFPDDAHPRLFEARANASIMADAIQEAFVDFMRAKAMMSPVLLVLEDLHWGDMPSTRLVDAVLREIGHLPIVVLGLGRPEVHEAFPSLWQGRAVQSVRLGRLSKKAAEAMIGAILGDSIDRAHIDAIVERADGNAFFIEELSRAVASGRAETLPETVAGMVETRIMSLPPALRLALRAASIFGRTFRPDGAAALIDQTLRNGAAGIIFDELVDREFLERKSSSRQFGPDELAFRQALIQQAAYGMLTERDRTIGHKLAAEWLESMGEPDPMTLAEHFARGGEPARAVGYYLGAARQALHGGDDRAALERVKRALVCGAEGETQAALLAIQYEALRSANPNAILSHAEALFAADRMQEAKAVLGYLLSDLLAQAQAIKDPESRRFFWQNVPMRARAFELAKLWGLERA